MLLSLFFPEHTSSEQTVWPCFSLRGNVAHSLGYKCATYFYRQDKQWKQPIIHVHVLFTKTTSFSGNWLYDKEKQLAKVGPMCPVLDCSRSITIITANWTSVWSLWPHGTATCQAQTLASNLGKWYYMTHNSQNWIATFSSMFVPLVSTASINLQCVCSTSLELMY